MTDQSELVERVARAIYEAGPPIRDYCWHDLTQLTQGTFYKQARAAIAAMGDGSRIEAIEADNARLREALKPFAAAADYIDTDPPEDHQPSHGRGMVKAYNLRAARTALGDKP